MKKTKLSMAMLGASAMFALMSASTQAQNMSNQNAATGTAKNTTAQAASNPNAATQGAQGTQSTQGMATDTMKGSTQTGQMASGAGAGTLNKADQKMVKDMAMVNMAEIETARMAQSKSQSDQVKAYAQRMIDDHTKGLTDVQQLAQAKGMTLPTELDKAHKAKGAKLAKLSGEQFDKAYMAQAGVADHKAAHAKVQAAAKKATDPDVKALAGRLHPTVQEHLKMAQDAHAGHGTAATGSSGAAGTTGSGSNASGSSMDTSDKMKDKR